jgi:hypothetical protein
MEASRRATTSCPKVVEAEALMQHAVPPGLVEPAVRHVPFALLARSKVKLADSSGDGHGVPLRGAPADSTHSKAVGANLSQLLALVRTCDGLGAISRRY